MIFDRNIYLFWPAIMTINEASKMNVERESKFFLFILYHVMFDIKIQIKYHLDEYRNHYVSPDRNLIFII